MMSERQWKQKSEIIPDISYYLTVIQWRICMMVSVLHNNFLMMLPFCSLLCGIPNWNPDQAGILTISHRLFDLLWSDYDTSSNTPETTNIYFRSQLKSDHLIKWRALQFEFWNFYLAICWESWTTHRSVL